MKSKKEVMKDVSKVRRHKIVIQKHEVTEGDLCNQKEEWNDYLPLWVEINGLWGRDYYAAKAIGEEQTLELTARDCEALKVINTVEYRVVFGGKTYDIKNIDPVKYEGQWVKIKALERGSDG